MALHGKQVFAIPAVVDGDRLGLRFVASGRAVYLTGYEQDRFLERSDGLEHERDGLLGGEVAAQEPLMSRVALVYSRLVERVHVFRELIAHPRRLPSSVVVWPVTPGGSGGGGGGPATIASVRRARLESRTVGTRVRRLRRRG
jgi:hypothetical protein